MVQNVFPSLFGSLQWTMSQQFIKSVNEVCTNFECFDIATVDCFIPTENKLLPNGTQTSVNKSSCLLHL